MHSNLITNNEIPTINSREVSQMLEIQHKNLLSKIDLINKDLVAENLATKKYWIEDTFENRGKQYRQYQITKLGCEFLAHKTTGTKGNLFTARYMDKFEKMEKELIRPSYQIEDPIARAEAWIEEEKQRQQLLQENNSMRPQAEKFINFIDTDGTMSFRELVKHLNYILNRRIAENQIRKLLIEMGVLAKQGKRYVISQEGVRNGYGVIKDYIAPDGKNRPQNRYTDKLRSELINMLK